MAIVRPIAEWPEILCGPILRHSTTSGIHVFLVRKSEGSVAGKVVAEPNGAALATGSSVGIRVGTSMYVHLVPIEGALPADTHLHYDLTLSYANDPKTEDLKKLGLLNAPYELGYAPDTLPSFVLPGAPEDFQFVHGSCRKLHGGGVEGLILADKLIEANLVEPKRRPKQLLLTGDQIYADDVHPALLRTIASTSVLLTGWSAHDKVPVAGALLGLMDDALDPEKPERKDFATSVAGFTSGYSQAHLALLGEFLTMYIMAWSDALWPRDTSGKPLSLAEGDADRGDSLNSMMARVGALSRVRRVLANLPSYMIFDDHEVTDDWNIDREWRDTVNANPAGRTVIRNALLAFGLFQDWGNRPAEYKPAKAGEKILNALKTGANGAPAIFGAPASLDAHFGLASGAAMRWNWRHDFGSHRLTALDTRTRRLFPTAKRGAPELMGKPEMGNQIVGDASKPIHIIMSGAPILGATTAELAQALMVGRDAFAKALQDELFVSQKNHVDATREYDNEAWNSNPLGFENVLKSIGKAGGAIVVSGDVHYAFTISADYNWRDAGTVKHAKIVQLCSSSLANADDKTEAIGAIGHPALGRTYVSYADIDLSTHAAELLELAYPPDSKVRLRIADAKSVGGLDFFYNVVRGLSKPAVLPVNYWFNDALVNKVNVITANLQQQAWYQLSFHREDGGFSDVIASVDFSSLNESKVTNLKSHLNTIEKGTNYFANKQIVGRVNLGQVSFQLDAGNLAEITHDVHYHFFPTDAPDVTGVMRHVIDAEANALSSPPSFRKGP